MTKFPLKFKVNASAKEGISSQWAAEADALPPIPSAIPPEFSGPGGGYSPEDLFGIALINCLIALYKVYSERAKVSFKQIQVGATVVADKQPSESSFVITEINLSFHILGASDKQRAREVLDQAIKDCPISNSIRSGKTFDINIS